MTLRAGGLPMAGGGLFLSRSSASTSRAVLDASKCLQERVQTCLHGCELAAFHTIVAVPLFTVTVQLCNHVREPQDEVFWSRALIYHCG